LQQYWGQAELLSKIAKELEIYQGSRKNEFQKKYADLLKSRNQSIREAIRAENS
jgi:hypothetical protein